MRQFIGTLSLVVLLQGVQIAQAAPQPTADLSSDPVTKVVAAGLMTPDANGNFREEQLLSRAELASILVRTFQLDKRTTANQGNDIPVDDVPSNHWAYKDIQTVLKTGTMQGYRGRLFYPNQKVTRAEAFAIFAQAYGVFQFPDRTVETILSGYPDAAEIPSWAYKAMATALNEGFVNLDDSGRINPLKPATRGDLAFALSEYLDRQVRPGSAFQQDVLPSP